jgi:hypothetical protein
VNQGPRWDCLIKKTRSRKYRDIVPLSAVCRSSTLLPSFL